MATAYRAQLGAWYSQLTRDYKACMPQALNFSLNFGDQRSDLDLYKEALALYDLINKLEDGDFFHTKPHRRVA